MKLGRKVSKNTMKVVVGTAIVIFSLFTAISGTYAWFIARASTTIEVANFAVVKVEGDCQIEEINLIKFKYGLDVLGNIDYSDKGATAADAGVFRYEFNGNYYVDDDDEPVEMMNLYDPVAKTIGGNAFSLFSMNCNAIYEITFRGKVGDYVLDIEGNWDKDKTKDPDQIFLSDCIDFYAFYESDLSIPIGTDPETGKPLYYPSYIEYDPLHPLSELEDLYYRFSYLASTKTTSELAHLYDIDPKVNKHETVPVDSDIAVTFDEDEHQTFKVYVNANYAPDQLTSYLKQIYSGNIRAVYDFNFNFIFTKEENS